MNKADREFMDNVLKYGAVEVDDQIIYHDVSYEYLKGFYDAVMLLTENDDSEN